MPLKAGWKPLNVYACLSNLVEERPDGKGGMVPCETWDNATIVCQTEDPQTGSRFPMTIKTQRISPGNTNTWYFQVLGMAGCARWSSRQINTLKILKYDGNDQAWQVIDMGNEMAYKSRGYNKSAGHPR